MTFALRLLFNIPPGKGRVLNGDESLNYRFDEKSKSWRFWFYLIIYSRRLENITHVAKRGGVHEIVTFSKIFFPKNRFLSDYVVGGCPKYIFGKLRSFLKISEKKFFKIFLLGDSKPNWLKVPTVKNCTCRLKRPKIAHDPKKSFFSKSEISSTQSNHEKRNIKLMLVRP